MYLFLFLFSLWPKVLSSLCSTLHQASVDRVDQQTRASPPHRPFSLVLWVCLHEKLPSQPCGSGERLAISQVAVPKTKRKMEEI